MHFIIICLIAASVCACNTSGPKDLYRPDEYVRATIYPDPIPPDDRFNDAVLPSDIGGPS